MSECKNCLYTTDIPSVEIGPDGICNYCKQHERLDTAYPISDAILSDELKRLKTNKKYDCLLGISGGCDSSFLLHLLIKHGLNPLVIHFNNDTNTEEATKNIAIMRSKLKFDYIEYTIGQEYHDIVKSLLYASVPDADITNDVVMASFMYDTAERFKIKTIINGHNFRTEGTTPVGWTMMNDKYMQDVYGKPLHNFPLWPIYKQIIWALKGIKQVRPLYWINFTKQEMKEILIEKYGWVDYGGQHCENIYTYFVGGYLLPIKFGIDKRIVYLSAQIRSGYITKEDAVKEYNSPPEFPDKYLAVVKKFYNISDSEFNKIMAMEIKHHTDFGNYKKLYRRWKFVFYILTKLGYFPQTFYNKYCK